MIPSRVVALINSAALGAINLPDLEQLLTIPLPKLLIARTAFVATAPDGALVPSERLVKILHATIHAPLSHEHTTT